MASEIEELREQLEDAVDDAELDAGMEFAIWPIVDSLISAARAEGKAEGAGKHEGWVIATADGRFHSLVIDDKEYAQRMCAYEEHVVRVTYGDPTASVLAPTKESEK